MPSQKSSGPLMRSGSFRSMMREAAIIQKKENSGSKTILKNTLLRFSLTGRKRPGHNFFHSLPALPWFLGMSTLYERVVVPGRSGVSRRAPARLTFTERAAFKCMGGHGNNDRVLTGKERPGDIRDPVFFREPEDVVTKKAAEKIHRGFFRRSLIPAVTVSKSVSGHCLRSFV